MPGALALRFVAITLGIAAPYADMFSTFHIINKSRFGSQQFLHPILSAGP